MCSISDIPIVGAALNHISEATVGALFRGIGYILFYNNNVAKLKIEIEGLNTKEQEIERRVERAKNNAKTIKEHVSKWQADAKVINDEVAEVLKKYEKVRTSWRRANPYRRFQLGRRAAKKTTTVSEFSDLEKKLLTGEIAYFQPKDYNPISSTGYQTFGSREVAYKKILKALMNYKEVGFPVVGLYGFGGVGKTRMMEEASKEVKAKGIFKTVARANVGQVVDIGKIQDQLATYLNITERREEDRASQLKDRLSKEGDTILVILDDVWSEIPFAEIGIPFGDASSIKGCKILLTSRLRDVCNENNCEDPVEIEALTEDEAWGMFSKTVDISTIESVGDSLARQVCNKCARLPLIIAAVGKALHKKSKDSWEDARHKLMKYNPEKIQGIPPDAYACLRLSFNKLIPDAYLCLLLCSLAGEDEEIQIEFLFRLVAGSGLLEDWNTYTLEAARNRVNVMVSELKSSSLLLEGRDYDSVKLHDIIRDVARSITAKDPRYLFLSESNCSSSWQTDISSRKLIYLDFKSDSVYFPDNLECPDLHTLYLECSHLRGPDSIFKSFTKLKHLWLGFKYPYELPSSIQNLDTSLRSLTLKGCKVHDMSHIIQLKILEMLTIQKSSDESSSDELFLDESSSDESFGGLMLDLQQFSRLRMLDLAQCSEITGIVLSGLVCLEELYLPKGCSILDEETKRKTPLSSVPSKLTSLEIYFEDVKSCPDENFCKNLCRYKICVGGDKKFWKHDSAIKSVYLCNDCIDGGVKTLVERGDYVTLERVTGLQKCFSQGGGAFTDLKWLYISECIDDEYLFRIHGQPHQRVGSFSKLSVLKIYSSGFKYLFCTSTARCLPQLEELLIYDCEMMEEIVRNEGQINEFIYFPKLSELRLSSLPMFKSLCGKVVFPALERLCVSYLYNITKIWEEYGHLEESFCQLKFLKVQNCHKLKNVIPYAMRQRLQNLDTLEIYRCDSLISEVQGPNGAEIAERLVVLPKLKKLELRELPKLMETGLNSSDIILYPNLTTLSIDKCNNLRNVFLPSVVSHLELLEQLKITCCEMMNELIASVGKDNKKIRVNNIEFPMLKTLELKELPMMNSFWGYGIAEPDLDQQKSSQASKQLEVRNEGQIKMMEVRNKGQINEIIYFPKLKDLHLTSLPVFKSFSGKVVFPALERLHIYALDSITEIWEEHGHLEESFCQLKILEVFGCHKLKNVIPYAMRQRLQNLDTLEIYKCDSLISEVEGPNGAEIAEPLVVLLPKLKTLELRELPKLMEIGLNSSDIILYPNLTTLSIDECNNLRNVFLPSVVSHLELLEQLKITFEFPMLRTLKLKGLPMMNSFWGYGTVEPNLDQQKSSQALKVAFPSLEFLRLNGLKINLEQIYLGRDDSTSKLRSVNIIGIERPAPQLIIPPNWLLASRDLEDLNVRNCYFHEGDLFSLLGKNNPYGTISFGRLRKVEVNSCGLSTIFTCSVAKVLQELELLVVRSCGSVEEIVTDDERRCNDEELVHVEEISFPKLREIELEDLPNLKSFCPSANYCFKMPSLWYVTIRRCPQLLSFTPGQIQASILVTIANPGLDTCEEFTTDINSCLHQMIRNTQQDDHMDSGNSESLQSSSGGNDEYGLRASSSMLNAPADQAQTLVARNPCTKICP